MIDLGLTIPEWSDQALCAETDPELFFPEKGSPTVGAKAVCRRCPVAVQCLTFALDYERDNPPLFGIWGGVPPKKRQALLRRQPSPAQKAEAS